MANQSTKAALQHRGNDTRNGNTAGAPQSLQGLLERQKPEIGRALTGTALNPERFARVALTVIKQSPQLQQCRPESLLGALMTSAQLGLEPGPLGEAYLVPYGDQVTFIPGYRGLIKLAWNSGQLKSISAHVVHENDDFDYAYGLEPFLQHKPALGDRGGIWAAYAAATLTHGGSEFIVMSVSDVEKIRARSKSGKKGPWVTDWDAMACKTAVRQLAKFLPMATAMNQAMAAEGSVRSDVAGGVEDLATGADEVLDGEVVDSTEDDQPQDTANVAEYEAELARDEAAAAAS